MEDLDWDEPLPKRLYASLEEWINDLERISEFSFPRCLKLNGGYTKNAIHVFMDSSEKAYAAAAYLRSENKSEVKSNLIACKTKVAPLVWTSMPRLELMGAILGLKLSKKISKALQIEATLYWTDSKDVLGWIRNKSRNFKPFVAQRIGQIQDQSNLKDWKYVPSSENPADIATRGCSAESLRNNKNGYMDQYFFGCMRVNGQTIMC